MKTAEVSKFLLVRTHPDLAAMYGHDMEVQVNVLKLNGKRVEKSYEGKPYHQWEDDAGNAWKAFRIPFNANTKPMYYDSQLRFSLDTYAEGIGMTGWDWKSLISRWVAFDFDAIVGHSDKHTKKMTNDELELVKEKLNAIPWVQIRRSTGGAGLHVYVHLCDSPVVGNHSEHAAIARSVLSHLSLLVNYPLSSKVDICGGNMWVWHRKMEKSNGQGLAMIKAHTETFPVPQDWKDHLDVTTHKRSTTIPKGLDEAFLELSGQRAEVELDADHLKLVDYFTSNKLLWWWNADHRMMVTHTAFLARAHLDLKLKGIFNTSSTGQSGPGDHNCFCFPLPSGAWVVRRYGKAEVPETTWGRDKVGFEWCYFNKPMDICTLVKLHGGKEHPKGGFQIDEIGKATALWNDLNKLMKEKLDFPPWITGRSVKISPHNKSNSKITISIDWDDKDAKTGMESWIVDRKKYTRVLTGDFEFASTEIASTDNLIRHVVDTSGKDGGWFLKVSQIWHNEPLLHIRAAMSSLGLDNGQTNQILGENVLEPWKIVSQPFEVEYPGNRQWNRNTAQLRFAPIEATTENPYPTWEMLLEHCGRGLNEDLKANVWAVENSIESGGDYLRCWIASLIKAPKRPLPYLFFWSKEQNTGKSIFHEALTRLIVNGYMRAEAALTSTSAFNGELETRVICAVDEMDLRANSQAYNRIKDWVTADQILIHPKSKIPYMMDNTTHWIHTANDSNYCPIFEGDTRITSIHVRRFEGPLIPRIELFEKLDSEAPFFLHSLLRMELPASGDRLNIPVISTQSKIDTMYNNTSDLDRFIEEECDPVAGHCITIKHFYAAFVDYLDRASAGSWGKRQMTIRLPEQHKTGRINTKNAHYVSNVKFKTTSKYLNDVHECHLFTEKVEKYGDLLRVPNKCEPAVVAGTI